MKKIRALFMGLMVLIGLVAIRKNSAVQLDDSVCTIGIIQTASHPALDQVRENFQAEFSRLVEGKVRFIVQNAEGSLSQAQSIAVNFHEHGKIQAIVAIATPAVQAAARIEKKKPIIIAAVSNPALLGVVYKGTNVCGTTDRINTDAQAKMIREFFPQAKKVAILFNPAENNSQACVVAMEEALDKRLLEHTRFAVHSESEVSQVLASAVSRSDILLLPTDNLLANAITLVAKEALKKKCPLVVSDIHLVQKGALIAEGADYGSLGKETAQSAYTVLVLKKSPEEVGICDPKDSKIVINKRVLESLQVPVPKEVVPSVTFVE